jgi:hypothetical protein
LKLTFSKHMGQKCLICDASFYFGSKVIIPKLRLKGGNLSSYKSLNRAIKSPLMISQNI